MEKNPDSINLEWYHHMKCWKRFCDEKKIWRQQRKEEKGEGTTILDKTIDYTLIIRPQNNVESVRNENNIDRWRNGGGLFYVITMS